MDLDVDETWHNQGIRCIDFDPSPEKRSWATDVGDTSFSYQQVGRSFALKVQQGATTDDYLLCHALTIKGERGIRTDH